MHAPGLLTEAAVIMPSGMELFLLFMHAQHLASVDWCNFWCAAQAQHPGGVFVEGQA